MRRSIALFGVAVVAIALFTIPTREQGRWVGALTLGTLLVGIGRWPSLGNRVETTPRSIVNAGFTFMLAFAMLATQLLRLQIVQSEATATRSAIDPASGDVVSNSRAFNAQLSSPRGAIVDRDGVILAESVVEDGIALRRYPNDAASYVTGYFSPLKYGETGVEKAFDDQLSGDSTGNDLTGAFDDLLGRQPRGQDVQLTLSADLQRSAEDLLDGRTGAIVLLDVKTGEVLVLASSPHPDPNDLSAVDAASSAAATLYWATLVNDPSQPLLPRATEGLYTPGSTFKAITASAAIDSGTASASSIYSDTGSLDVDGHIIVEENRPDDSIGEWTLQDGLAYSLNVVFAQVGLQLGAATLTEYSERFGFGSDIPFDLPVARSQVASSPGFLALDAAVADTAFGQGELLATPLQMALVAAAIANDGVEMTPYLVSSIVEANGSTVRKTEPTEWRRPITGTTATAVQALMINAVENGYVNGAAIEGLIVGGKTGTAETGTGDPHAWFIGFAGRDEPEYAVSVVLEHGGSGVGEPVAIGREIMRAAIGGS